MSIKLIIGPMGAGKSSEMCTDLERYSLIPTNRCVIIKYAGDARYDHLARAGGIVTHSGTDYSRVKVVSARQLADVSVDGFNVVGVSELQMFPDYALVDAWASAGKRIVAEALDATYRRDDFNGICGWLVPRCEEVIKKKAICMSCHADAYFTMKHAGDKSATVEIGAFELYRPVCRACYNTGMFQT
jgi:thymidine kinase